MAEKTKSLATVVSQEKIAADIYSLILATPAAQKAAAGQFVSVYCIDRTKLLPRPISICEINRAAETLRLVYRVTGRGTGTEEFSRLKTGDQVEILGPLGNGFPLTGKKPLVIGGGIGVPPMLELAQALSRILPGEEAKAGHAAGHEKAECGGGDGRQEDRDACVTAVLGYRDSQLFLKEEFEPWAKVYVSTDDGSAGTKGTVIDAVKENGVEADIIFACGPKPMLRAVKAYAAEKGIPCYVSLEERMACGIGACLGCVCRTTGEDAHSHVHNARVCKDGPVFAAEEVEL